MTKDDEQINNLVEENKNLKLELSLYKIGVFQLEQTTSKLAQSEKDYKNLADSGRALIWTATPDKLCNYFNNVWLKFTGRTFEQEKGNGWAQGVHPDDFKQCLATYVNAFDKRQPFSMEYRMRRHDGVYRWILDDGSPRYDDQDKFIGYIGHCLDITDKKDSEQLIINSNKELEKMNSFMVNRELKMYELKKEIVELKNSQSSDKISK